MDSRFIPANHGGAECAGLEGHLSGVFTVPGCSLLHDWLLRSTHRKVAEDSPSGEERSVVPGSPLPAQRFSLWAFFSHTHHTYTLLSLWSTTKESGLKKLWKNCYKYFKTTEIIVGMAILGLFHVGNMD